MKIKTYAAFALAILATACTKDDNGGNGGGGSSSALISPSTGWKKVGTIPYSASVTGFEGYDAMTPYDLTVVDGELALIYSEDYKLTSVDGNNMFKVKFGSSQKDISGAIHLNRGGYSFCNITRFIPGSFTPVYTKISNNNPSQIYECLVADDENGFIAGNNVSGFTPRSPINWYPDGGFTMSVKEQSANGNISSTLSYTYPNAGNFDTTLDQWGLDPTHWIQTSALRLSGGEINQLIVSYDDNDKVFFSIIKDDPSYVPTNGVQHDFFMLARQEMAGLNADNFRDHAIIIASKVENDTYTVLLGDVTEPSGSRRIGNVYCYQWQKGTTQFTKLYGPIAVPEDVGYNLYYTVPVGTAPDTGTITPTGAPVKFTPDNTAYMLFRNPAFNGSVNYTALATINGSGCKVSGKYSEADNTSSYAQIGLGVCQYYNGAYYAVVYQKNSHSFGNTDAKFRMEIVKIEP